MASLDRKDPASYPYETHLDIRFAPLNVVDVPSLVAVAERRGVGLAHCMVHVWGERLGVEKVQHPWYNQTLCKVNDSVIRLGVFEPGEYHWHKHDEDDEFFFVLEGRFILDLEGKSIELKPQEGFVVPKGVVHRTRAPERTATNSGEVASANLAPTASPTLASAASTSSASPGGRWRPAA